MNDGLTTEVLVPTQDRADVVDERAGEGSCPEKNEDSLGSARRLRQGKRPEEENVRDGGGHPEAKAYCEDGTCAFDVARDGSRRPRAQSELRAARKQSRDGARELERAERRRAQAGRRNEDEQQSTYLLQR